MGEFKVGGIAVAIETSKYNGITQGQAYIVCDVDAQYIKIRKDGGHCDWVLRRRLKPGTDSPVGWSTSRADELRKIAEDAITDYNMFLALQPEQYKPMELKGELSMVGEAE